MKYALFLLALAAAAQAPPMIVLGEVPAPAATFGQWTLTHPPLAVACYRNGLRQRTGIDFTVIGGVITSITWRAADKLLCDFTYPSTPPTFGPNVMITAPSPDGTTGVSSVP